MSTANLNAQYAWAGADDADKAAVAAIYKHAEAQEHPGWAVVVNAWEHYEVHAYYVTAGRDLDRAIADIASQVVFY